MKHFLALTYFAVIALIVYLADQPDSLSVLRWIHSVPGADKICHFLLIGGLAFLANYSLRCRTFKIGTKSFLLASVIVAILVTLEEVSQLFIPSRTFDLLDLLFDYLGIWTFGKLAKRHIQNQKPLTTDD